MNSKETFERLFYEIDEAMLDRIVREVMAEELSVVEGGILERFETAVAEFFGARHSVAACNGTAALHMALFAIDIKPGDEVLIPAYGYYATALPVCMLGGTPVFCDIKETDMTIDVTEAGKMITNRTRAIIAHQPWGCPANVDELRSLADRHDLILLSDSSHAHGALWKGRPLGHYYDFVCASFGKGKLISGGELGVVTTNNDRFLDRMLLYGHVNRVPGGLITPEYRHMHNAVGVKYRPHPFAMALAFEQLKTYEERSRKLVQHVGKFENSLSEIKGFGVFTAPREADRVYWRVLVKMDTNRLGSPESVVTLLQEENCPVERKGRVLIPYHNVFTDYYGVNNQQYFPVAEGLVNKTFQVQAFALHDDSAVNYLLSRLQDISANPKIGDAILSDRMGSLKRQSFAKG